MCDEQHFFPLTGGCSEGLGAFRFFFKNPARFDLPVSMFSLFFLFLFLTTFYFAVYKLVLHYLVYYTIYCIPEYLAGYDIIIELPLCTSIIHGGNFTAQK